MGSYLLGEDVLRKVVDEGRYGFFERDGSFDFIGTERVIGRFSGKGIDFVTGEIDRHNTPLPPENKTRVQEATQLDLLTSPDSGRGRVVALNNYLGLCERLKKLLLEQTSSRQDNAAS